MKTFGEKIMAFNRNIDFSDPLPKGIKIMNPFKENGEILPITEMFYKKFYGDYKTRKLILGINPGKFGSGVTGIPFTDTKRLIEICKIPINSVSTHEPSSVFIYELIKHYGGVEKFYGDYYINSLCPLGFIKKNEKGNWINLNYYDDKELLSTMEQFMISSLKEAINFGLNQDTCFVLGKKNAKYVKRINVKEKLFANIVELDHPRYIEQYKSKFRPDYIKTYLEALKENG